MKTKIKLLLIVCLLFCAGNVMAQTFLYDTSRAISAGGRDGVFFQADVSESGGVRLYNRVNRFTYAEQTIDGRRRGFDEEIRDLVHSDWRTLAMRIVRESFSASEISRIQQGEHLGIVMIICPQTGRVIEVNFSFSNRSGYATIGVPTFWRIERALKEQMRFTPTAEGRRMNYIIRFWHQELVPSPSRRRPSSLIPPAPPPPDNQPPPPDNPPPPHHPIPPHLPEDPSGGSSNRVPETELDRNPFL